MPCQVCLRTTKRFAFNTGRIRICRPCVDLLNTPDFPARVAYDHIEKQLRAIIVSEAESDMMPGSPAWKKARGERVLSDFDSHIAVRLPAWLNGRAETARYTDPWSIRLRAHRRGLLRRTERVSPTYPADWAHRSHEVRIADRLRCAKCGATDVVLQAHHIVYVRNHGTHRKANLVTLCITCHSMEHGRQLDVGEESQIQEVAVMTPTPSLQLVPHASQDIAKKPESPPPYEPAKTEYPLWAGCLLLPFYFIAAIALALGVLTVLGEID